MYYVGNDDDERVIGSQVVTKGWFSRNERTNRLFSTIVQEERKERTTKQTAGREHERV